MKIDYDGILKQIENAYKSVKPINGYRFEIKPARVYREQLTRNDIPDTPAVIIAPSDDIEISPGLDIALREWTVETGILYEKADILPKNIEDLKDDCMIALEKAFYSPSDPITVVEIREVDPTAIVKGDFVAGFKINLAIQYFRNS